MFQETVVYESEKKISQLTVDNQVIYFIEGQNLISLEKGEKTILSEYCNYYFITDGYLHDQDHVYAFLFEASSVYSSNNNKKFPGYDTIYYLNGSSKNQYYLVGNKTEKSTFSLWFNEKIVYQGINAIKPKLYGRRSNIIMIVLLTNPYQIYIFSQGRLIVHFTFDHEIFGISYNRLYYLRENKIMSLIVPFEQIPSLLSFTVSYLQKNRKLIDNKLLPLELKEMLI